MRKLMSTNSCKPKHVAYLTYMFIVVYFVGILRHCSLVQSHDGLQNPRCNLVSFECKMALTKTFCLISEDSVVSMVSNRQFYSSTYIYHSHIWHRNKLSRCQLELLVSCSDNKHETSLKWDRSSHLVEPECCVSHTVRLKHFAVSVLRPFEPWGRTFNVPAAWQAASTGGYLGSRELWFRDEIWRNIIVIRSLALYSRL
jgi:hypothetical protein